MNINRECGSVSPRVLQETVKGEGAALGVANDGDADRAVFVSEDGHTVDGDQILGALALDLKKHDQLARKTMVTTVMSNLGLEQAMANAGIKVVRTAVGDRYILERMLAEDYNFGGEQSGHIIFLDHNTTGDGLVSALQVLRIMIEKGCKLSELASEFKRYPQVCINVRVHSKPVLESVEGLTEVIHEVEKSLGHSGRILVRYSGTEALVR